MKELSLLAGLTLVLLALPVSPALAGQAEGVAVAIVYDTSGSMREVVPDRKGRNSPKYQVANRALEAIALQLQAASTNQAEGGPRRIDAGLFTFDRSGTKEVVRFGPLDTPALVKFAREFSNPGSGTPLGSAVEQAGRTLLRSELSHKHLLVITDGINTVGRPPEETLPGVRRDAEKKQTSLAVHFVAFDIDARVFAKVKKQGVTVVGAADEKQLGAQLDYIVKKKILLEEEEPPRKTN
jgi:hypothetical protein